jgi:AcrR family transcriptional regulator
MATTEQRTERPGGRSARVQAAVRKAVTELICDPDHEPVTIPAVAARAGVNPTSIYRRWGDVQQLLSDIAVTELDTATDVPDTGGLVGDLHGWAENVLAYLQRPGGIAFLRTAVNVAVDEEGRQRCLRNRRAELDVLLGRAAARGDTVPDREVLTDRVLAPLYFRVLFGIPCTGPDYARGLVDAVLAETGQASPA